MYFRKLCAPTSAAKTEPMLSAAMPDADVPAITLSKSAGAGMNALSEPLMAFPIMMPLISAFFCGWIGKRSSDVYRVVLAYKYLTRLPELLPRDDEVAVLAEHLNPVVSAVSDVYPSAGTTDEDVVRFVELARSGSLSSPGLDETAVLRKFHHAACAVFIRAHDRRKQRC